MRRLLARIPGMPPLSDEMHPWYQGALGELEVGRMLAALPDDYTVFHSVPVGTGRADIDHLVVGPGGVFTINTKHHRGRNVWVAGTTFMVSGQRQPHIRRSSREAAGVTATLRRRLPAAPAARGVIAVVGAKQLRITAAPADVTVLDAARLRRWIMKQKRMLAPDALAATVAALDSPGNWRDDAPAAPHAVAEFARLHRSVRAARRVRVMWGLGVVAASLIAVPAVGPMLWSMVAGALLP
ncbi:nuclease-related domain-containing protein [Marisediminicola sp. LYQ134]|uniref:nuclease-related domain-containing protein n=1 Tax=unclassified Marisediminicola TaxID=2618316 RepID=UPI003983A88A